MRWIIFGFVCFVLGWNIGGQGKTVKHLWNAERDGLQKLNSQMKEDKSERLAVCIITEKQTYGIKSVENEMFCGLRPIK